MGARHHRRKQFGKQRARAQRVGVGQRRAPRRRGPEVVKTALVALQSRRDLAQAHGPLQLAIEQGNKLAFGAQSPHPPVRFMLLHQPVKDIPRHRLQHTVKHAIVIRMALIPSRVRIVGETSRTEWNQCRAPCRPKLNRTAVPMSRGWAAVNSARPEAFRHPGLYDALPSVSRESGAAVRSADAPFSFGDPVSVMSPELSVGSRDDWIPVAPQDGHGTWCHRNIIREYRMTTLSP